MARYIRPINPRLLVHTCEWFKNKINPMTLKNDNENHGTIHKVLVERNRNMYADTGLNVQQGSGNGIMYGDKTYSTPLPNNEMFAVGDTLKFRNYPYVGTIRNVVTANQENTDEIHHIEITFD